jgi:hypothetical protein
MLPESHTNPIHAHAPASTDSSSEKDIVPDHLVEGLWVEADETTASREGAGDLKDVKERVMAHRADLNSRAKHRLQEMIGQLLNRSSVGEEEGVDEQETRRIKRQWEDTVFKLATRAVNSVMPQV